MRGESRDDAGPLLDRWLNASTDVDWGWWPLLRLRPARDERFTLGLLATVSAYFGPPTGLVWALLGLILDIIEWPRAIAFVPFGLPFFFIVWGALFVPPWNRRAKRLALRGR